MPEADIQWLDRPLSAMSANDEATPPTSEIVHQLERMLAGNRFAAAPNQADFLSLVVRRALKGKKTTEDIIGRELFGEKFTKDESTDVRVTASNLRKALRNYYGNDGREDRVMILLREPPRDKRIKLPPGEAYRPLFSYNPNHPESQKFRLGSHYLAQKSPEALSEALRYLHDVALTQTSHVPAHVGLVEALCAMSVYLSRSTPTPELLSVACQIVRDAIALNPDDWHTHAARGAALLCMGELQQANEEFDAALRLDKAQTLNYYWYPAFLLTTNQRERALELARVSAAERVESPQAHAAYGLYLYAMRRFEEAEQVLTNALKLDRNYWLTRVMLSALCLALDRPDDALGHYERIQLLVDEKASWIMPGLGALCACKATKITKKKRSFMCRWAKELIAKIDPDVDWFQAALACIGFGEPENAVISLEHAYNHRHPLVLWLDAWPILDPLRLRPDFQAILTALRLPSKSL